MFEKIILISLWLVSFAIVYYFVLDRVGSKLFTDNLSLYNQIKEGQVKIEDQIKIEEETKKDLEKQSKILEQNKTDGHIKEEQRDYKSVYVEPKAKFEKNIAESKAKLALYQEIKDKGLNGIDFSLWNLGKGLGSVLFLGLTLHLIFKWIINLWNKKE